MWLVNQIFLLIITFTVAVNCQGGGGGGSGGGAFGLIFFVVAIFCWPVYCCWKCFAGKPRRSNMKFVTKGTTNNEEEQIIDIKLFQTGLWESQYFQYDKWHGPHQIHLSFDVGQSKVTGSGSDDIGLYSIDGVYSAQSRRMGLTKTYQFGTGNPLENLGHNVIIQLEWNRYNNQFEGKWYVRTKRFMGSNEFKIKIQQRTTTATTIILISIWKSVDNYYVFFLIFIKYELNGFIHQ